MAKEKTAMNKKNLNKWVTFSSVAYLSDGTIILFSELHRCIIICVAFSVAAFI